METFIKYIIVLIGIYIAQTTFKIASTRADGSFDFSKLLNGMLDYAIYFVGIFIFFYVGSLINDVEIVPLGDKKLTIDDALTMLMYGLILIQSKKCFDNIKETFKITDDQIPVVIERQKEIG